MIFFVVEAVAYFITLMFQCEPLDLVWDPVEAYEGFCMQPAVVRGLAYANNGKQPLSKSF
jgi:hypothetical protein